MRKKECLVKVEISPHKKYLIYPKNREFTYEELDRFSKAWKGFIDNPETVLFLSPFAITIEEVRMKVLRVEGQDEDS